MIATLKRLLRPLIPDRVMARYRLHQHSRFSRSNVDVFLDDRRLARRWLTATPDTFRVRLALPVGDVDPEVVAVDDPSIPVDSGLRVMATQCLADPWLGAVVVGEVDEPRLVDRRRVEPTIGPRLLVVRAAVLDEVGGAPRGDHPLPGLLARIRDAGHPIGLIPMPGSGAPVVRSDPIEEDAVVILAAVPMHDIGGGSRSTQLALEFLRQGFHVTLVSLYEAQESVDLGIRYTHPSLEQYRVERFDPQNLASRVGDPGLVLVEAPAGPLIDRAVSLQEAGWELVYDVIDEWSDPALGGDWFDGARERDLIVRADRVLASAPDLVDRMWRMGREATLVPNAVNPEIFSVDLPPRPVDLPQADIIIGYHGSLYGNWFDWEALLGVAEAFPDAALVIIGDDKAPRPEMPENVYFLGLKAQTDLPAYLQRLDVGIIPFKVNETTHAVSPLKAYEYLASGVPVAAPPLRSLDGLIAVTRDPDLSAAVTQAISGSRPNRASSISNHSWQARVKRLLLEGTATGEHRGGPLAVSVSRRPVARWARDARVVPDRSVLGKDSTLGRS